MRSAGSSLTDARQQGKVKGVEEPSGRGGHKVPRVIQDLTIVHMLILKRNACTHTP